MRGYHFTSLGSARLILASRKLKISLRDELNDPFELLGVTSEDVNIRNAWEVMRKHDAEHNGVICFSSKWSQPIMWSHYADRHRGICFGFDLSDEFTHFIEYKDERTLLTMETFTSGAIDGMMRGLLSLKHKPWEYEDEVRFHAQLNDVAEDGRYYAPFDENIQLREVLVGARCGQDIVEEMKLLADAIDPDIAVAGATLSQTDFEILLV